MKLYRKFENLLLSILESIWRVFIYLHEYKNIFSKRNIWKKVVLTEKQKKEIDEFYLQYYGKKIPYWWHRLYTSYTGKFDYRYIPEILYSTKLEMLTNKRNDVLPYENKNVLRTLFGDVNGLHIPRTFVMCINGCYFKEDGEPITKEMAIEYARKQCSNMKAVIKVSTDSNSGKGVKILDLKNGRNSKDGKSIEEIFNEMGKNFVFQEKIMPNEELTKIYEKSLNTIRVVSFETSQGIKIAPLGMRIGRGGAEIDNAHAGGIFIGLDYNGNLRKEAFSEYQERVSFHPDSGIKFEGYIIPKVKEICEMAKVLHRRIPIFKFVSWDFSIDNEENIVLLEVNLHSQAVWLSQMANGEAMFGSNTEEMLSLIKK